ncbi:MAG: SRPBCC family protein, partial [bacterium]|nr:SRPBCC family protein [bacterium]
MPEVSMSVKLNASADEVWGLIGGFNALPDWHPAAAKSTLEAGGKVRRLEVVGGAVVLERLERHSDADRACTYTIEEGPIPVSGYRATLRVQEDGAGCKVSWSSAFNPAG